LEDCWASGGECFEGFLIAGFEENEKCPFPNKETGILFFKEGK